MMDPPLRILHVRTVSGTGGGPDKTILNSCRCLCGRGCVTEAFYMLNARGDTRTIPDRARQENVPLHVVEENGPVSLGTIREFSRVLAKGNYHLVHTHDYKSNALAALVQRRYGFKFLATVHGYNRTHRREFVYYAVDRLALRFSHAVIAPSNNLANQLTAWGLRHVSVIPNGIDVSHTSRPAGKTFKTPLHLLYLGRLSPEKNPQILLPLMMRLKQIGLHAKLTVAGAGPLAETLAANIHRLNLDDSVMLAGHIHNVPPLLAQADLLINPSHTECFPNVLLEAMAAGVPVIATNVGGVSELVRDGVEGLLCLPRDVAALADCITRLAKDPAFADRLVQNAYARVVEKFSFETHIDQTMALYYRILHSHGNPQPVATAPLHGTQ